MFTKGKVYIPLGVNEDTKQTNLTNLIEKPKIRCRVLKKTPENLVGFDGEVIPSFEKGELIELEPEIINPLMESGYLEFVSDFDNPPKQLNHT